MQPIYGFNQETDVVDATTMNALFRWWYSSRTCSIILLDMCLVWFLPGLDVAAYSWRTHERGTWM